jgi:hypothetical protein
LKVQFWSKSVSFTFSFVSSSVISLRSKPT